jgi:murein L,D-transpeptidase YafK
MKDILHKRVETNLLSAYFSEKFIFIRKFFIISLGILLFQFSIVKNANANSPNIVIDMVKVDKSARRMYLMNGRKVVKRYKISLGGSPKGHKKQQGDKKTPEGIYTLGYINEKSKYYRSMHISYPNRTDLKSAKDRGVNAGSFIMIHGQKNLISLSSTFKILSDWTNGCIALSNGEMDEFLSLVPTGTLISIAW